jgi:hypothetical protein
VAFDSFVTPGAGGIGAGTVSIGLAANAGAARTTTIEIAGQPISLTQSAASPVRPATPAIRAPIHH